MDKIYDNVQVTRSGKVGSKWLRVKNGRSSMVVDLKDVNAFEVIEMDDQSFLVQVTLKSCDISYELFSGNMSEAYLMIDKLLKFIDIKITELKDL